MPENPWTDFNKQRAAKVIAELDALEAAAREAEQRKAEPQARKAHESVTLSVRIDGELADWLDRLAAAEYLPVSAVVRRLIRRARADHQAGGASGYGAA